MNKKFIVVAGLCLFSLAGYAQSAKRATARILEAQNAKISKIVVVYENGESEVIPLEPFNFMGVGLDKILVENQKTINKLINDMAEKGYEVEHINSSGDTYLYSFIIFKKGN
jgi:hypothetical protein